MPHAHRIQLPVVKVPSDDGDPRLDEEIVVQMTRREWIALTAVANGLVRLEITPELTRFAGALERQIDRILGLR